MLALINFQQDRLVSESPGWEIRECLFGSFGGFCKSVITFLFPKGKAVLIGVKVILFLYRRKTHS